MTWLFHNDRWRQVFFSMLAPWLLLLFSQLCRAETASIPLTIDYPLLTELYQRTAFTEGGGNKLYLVNTRGGCSQLVLADPKFSMQSGMLQLEIRIFARAGSQVGSSCLAPLEWGGSIRFLLKPQLNAQTFALGFTVIDSRLYNQQQRPDKMANVLWDFAEPYIFRHIAGIAINLAPPVNHLKSFLLPIFPAQTQQQSKAMLDSLTAGPVTAGETALSAELQIEVPQVYQPGQAGQSDQQMSKGELEKAVRLWETWDSFLVQMIATLSRQSLGDAEKGQLTQVLLDTRYAFVNAVEDNTVDEDFVRAQFLDAWQQLAPLFRRQTVKVPGESILGYLGFFTAADALKVFDRMGPAMGVEISEQGFVRLTAMLGNSEQSLRYLPGVNPLLRHLFQLPPEDKGEAPAFSTIIIEEEPTEESEPGVSPADAGQQENKAGGKATETSPGEALQRLRQKLHADDVPPEQVPPPSVPVPAPPPASAPSRQDFHEEDLLPETSVPASPQSSWRKQLERPLTWIWNFICQPAAAATNPPGAEKILEWRVPRKNVEAYLRRVRTVLEEAAAKVQQGKKIPDAMRPMFMTLVSAMAWQESCFRQFIQEGNTLTYLLSYNNTSVGVMQVNERVWRGIYDQNRLRWDIQYNAVAGAEIAALYLNQYALGGKKKLPPGKDVLARAVYAMYNGGPGQLEKFIERERTGKPYKSDQLFYQKLRWVQENSWDELADCLSSDG